MMLLLLCLLSLTLAEPPVRDSYLTALQSSHEAATSSNYLPPDSSVSSARTSFNEFFNQHHETNTNGLPQEYSSPSIREGLSQEYGVPTSSAFRSGISHEYGAPVARSQHYDSNDSDLGQSFSSADARNAVSQRYGAPSSRTLPSDLYPGTPSQRSLSTQNSAPGFRSTGSPIQKYGVPSFRNTQTSYSRSNSQINGIPDSSYLPRSKGRFDSFLSTSRSPQISRSQGISSSYEEQARSLPTQYDTPITRSGNAGYGASTSPLHTTYGVPGARNQHDTNGYSEPSFTRANLKNIEYTPSYPAARVPSSQYGVPASRTSMPSQQYGPPQEALSDQGYEYTRNSLEELIQEPANYEFAYKVSDDESGSDFGHTESRQLDRAEGAYFVFLPDGTKQVVEYEADENGFKPRISVEPAQSATALSAEGPY